MMGGIGGILGAVFNLFNYKLTVFRIRYLSSKHTTNIRILMVILAQFFRDEVMIQKCFREELNTENIIGGKLLSLEK